MKTIKLSALLLCGALLTACTPGGSQIVSGKISKNTATNPKVGMIFAEGGDDNAATSNMEKKVANPQADNKIPFDSVFTPGTDGKFTAELKKGTEQVSICFLYCWDDTDNNNKINGSETNLAKPTQGSQPSSYIFRNNILGFRVVNGQDFNYLDSISSYDFSF